MYRIVSGKRSGLHHTHINKNKIEGLEKELKKD